MEKYKNMTCSVKESTIDVRKGNGVFFDARNEFVDRNYASTLANFLVLNKGAIIDMSLSFNQTLPRKSMKVSILKNLFNSCLTLVKDEDDLAELLALIEEL